MDVDTGGHLSPVSCCLSCGRTIWKTLTRLETLFLVCSHALNVSEHKMSCPNSSFFFIFREDERRAHGVSLINVPQIACDVGLCA